MIEPTARPPRPDGGAERGRPVTGAVHAAEPHQPAAAPARVRVRTPTDTPSAPAGGRSAGPEPLVFPQIARLELDELLGQLAGRAQDVMATQSRLRGLLTATRAVASDLSLPVLLRQIVEAACELVGARYGAVGVLGGGAGWPSSSPSAWTRRRWPPSGGRPAAPGSWGCSSTTHARCGWRNWARTSARPGSPPDIRR